MFVALTAPPACLGQGAEDTVTQAVEEFLTLSVALRPIFTVVCLHKPGKPVSDHRLARGGRIRLSLAVQRTGG